MGCDRILQYDERYIINAANLEEGGTAAETSTKQLDTRARGRQSWLVWAYLGSFYGPEGGPYGHQCVVWSTWTLIRKVDVI